MNGKSWRTGLDRDWVEFTPMCFSLRPTAGQIDCWKLFAAVVLVVLVVLLLLLLLLVLVVLVLVVVVHRFRK